GQVTPGATDGESASTGPSLPGHRRGPIGERERTPVTTGPIRSLPRGPVMSQTPRPSPHRAEFFSARARLGLVNRKAVEASDEDKDNARRDLTAANIKAYIAEKVAEAPPLSIA